jgi:hypothetical protein
VLDPFLFLSDRQRLHAKTERFFGVCFWRLFAVDPTCKPLCEPSVLACYACVQSKLFSPKHSARFLQLWIHAFSDRRVRNNCREAEMASYCYLGLSVF